MDDIKPIFWGMLQNELYVQTPEVFLANRQGEDLLATDGVSYHKPILSQPSGGTYTQHGTINPAEKSATKQTMSVDTFKWAADQIDDIDQYQTPYDLAAHGYKAVREKIRLQVGQKFMDQISSAEHSLVTDPFTIDSTNILDAFEEAEGLLGAIDAPFDTMSRAFVIGPKTRAKLNRSKADRESRLGDTVLENGICGSWMGWTIVQSNNLPWSASLNVATTPTDGDTVTIAGVTFTFKTTLGSTAGNVLIGANAAAARANLAAAVNGTSGAGTTYVALTIKNRFRLEKRGIAATSAESMAFTGYGDISVRQTLTAVADIWSDQIQTPVFMVRGAIDLAVQFMKLKSVERELGFGTIIKGLVGVGAKAFDDGAELMVKLNQDASGF